MTTLIKECLLCVRISTENEAVINEIQSLIDACKRDLENHGVEKTNESDHLINRAIKLYVKAYFNTASKDSIRLQESYEMLRMSLSLSEDYRHAD